MSGTLFQEEKTEARPDWMNMVARQRYGMPDRWRWFRAEVKNHGKPSEFILLTGAVCDAKKQSGKYKGNDDWTKRDKATEAMVPIKGKDIEEVKLEWQQQTGKCFECHGTGQYCYGWDHKKGNLERPCKHCDAGKKSAEATGLHPDRWVQKQILW